LWAPRLLPIIASSFDLLFQKVNLTVRQDLIIGIAIVGYLLRFDLMKDLILIHPIFLGL
jgi:hypothetical protein